MPMGKGFQITSNPDLGSMVLAGYARHTKTGPILSNPSAQSGANGQLPCASVPALPRIKLAAISNDSVATLISLSYTTNAKANSKAAIGLILGTGTNAAVPMRPSTLHAKKVEYATRGAKVEQIVVNTEWTLRGIRPALTAHGAITRWDERLDQALATPGFQPFEYLTAGAYLGEVVRIAVFEYFTTHLGLEEHTLPPNLRRPYGLSTSWLGHHVAVVRTAAPGISTATTSEETERYTPPEDDLTQLTTKLNTSGELAPQAGSTFQWTPQCANVLLQTERAVLQRSTRLVAAAIIALLVTMGEVNLAADNSGRGGGEEGNGTIAFRHGTAASTNSPAASVAISNGSTDATAPAAPLAGAAVAAATPLPAPVPQSHPAPAPQPHIDFTPLSPTSPSNSLRSPPSKTGRELVVAYCGGLICLYDGYLERLQDDLKRLCRAGVLLESENDVAVVLREASEGGVIGAGVLAGTAAAAAAAVAGGREAG